MRLTVILLKPKASQVLTAYLKQCNEPPWTSYFIRQIDIVNDQFGQTNFNWTLDSGTNYQILRTGCFPYIKYHCTKKELEDLSLQNLFFSYLKVLNLGLPTLFYGMAATVMISHKEMVNLPGNKQVPIFFLYEEEKGSKF